MPKRLTNEEFVNRLKYQNINVTPLDTYINNRKKIKFRCLKCGNVWETIPATVLNGHTCPKCAIEITKNKTKKDPIVFINELKKLNPKVILIGDYVNALTKTKFKCKVCNYEWETKPNTILSGSGCPECKKIKISQSLKITNDEFVAKLKKVDKSIIPITKYEKSNKKIKIQCSICGNIWEATPNNLLRKYGCPKCNRIFSSSFPEQAVYYYMKKAYRDAINGYNDDFNGYELDIYIPSKKIGIEYDGSNWHSNTINKELKKYNICKKKQIFLIRIRETGLSNKRKNCDKYFKTKFVDKNYDDLTITIEEVLKFLNKEISVNVSRDYYEIQSMYLKTRNNNSIAQLYPLVAAEWNYEKNGLIKPEMVIPGSNSKYWWKCSKCGYEWKTSVVSRTRNDSGCRRCAGTLKLTNEEFLKRMKKINPNIIILDTYINSTTKISCKCTVCDNRWKASPSKLLNNRGCPKCGINRQRQTFLQNKIKKSGSICDNKVLMKEWDYSKNSISPKLCMPGSGKKVWWKCSKCDKSWEARISSRVNGRGCPQCGQKSRSEIRSKKVCQFSLDGSLIAEYNSITEAKEKTGVKSISSVCKNKRKSAGGYIWKYKE